jgi:hypothetical protein
MDKNLAWNVAWCVKKSEFADDYKKMALSAHIILENKATHTSIKLREKLRAYLGQESKYKVRCSTQRRRGLVCNQD